jgi:uncharacterized protein with PIN domain
MVRLHQRPAGLAGDRRDPGRAEEGRFLTRYPRIEEGYRHRFRRLLARVRPRRLEFGVELLMGRARERSLREGRSLPDALAAQYEHARVRVSRRAALMAACAVEPPAPRSAPRFACDASLGGLARWLRAAGYEARWRADASAEELAGEARREGLILLTTDTSVLRLRAVREGAADVLWIPPSGGAVEQLGLVLRDLELARREPRCMSCGGALARVEKDAVLDRIPPRTRRWKDDYFVCEGCGTLFWPGTHWERIVIELGGAASRPPDPPHASPK